MKCLGHIVTNEGRCPDPKKIQAILDIRPPRSPTGIKHIVGLILYEKDYVGRLANMLAPLNDIMHDDADVIKDWTDDVHGQSLRDIKQAFTSPPILKLPDFSRIFRLWVDTATQGGRGIGAVLSQYYGDLKGIPYDPLGTDVSGDNWETVCYWSKLLSKSERRYGVTEAEAKGMHDAIMHFSNYLSMGCFEVVVDHKCLLYIFNAPAITANRRLLRYALNLQKFTFRVLYRNGEDHLNADAISRLYHYGDDIPDVDEEEAINFDTVTAEDIRLLETKIQLDREYLKKCDVSPDHTVSVKFSQCVNMDIAESDHERVPSEMIAQIRSLKIQQLGYAQEASDMRFAISAGFAPADLLITKKMRTDEDFMGDNHGFCGVNGEFR